MLDSVLRGGFSVTKVTIFSGFLGAGKTTLIKKLIQEGYADEKIVLVENEYGDVNVDATFLQGTNVAITELTAGCICCSISGDFGSALRSILGWMEPDRIFIEPSGVAKLSDVLRNINQSSCRDQLEIDAVVTVVDASKCALYVENFGTFYEDQITSATSLLLTRTDCVSPETLDACVRLLRQYNPDAPLITTPLSALHGTQVRQVMEHTNSVPAILDDLQVELAQQARLTTHSADSRNALYRGLRKGTPTGSKLAQKPAFSTVGFETTQAFSQAQLTDLLGQLSDQNAFGSVLRAKGSVPTPDGGWLYFDYVPGEEHIRPGTPDVTGKLCLIGVDLQESALKQLWLNAGKETAR